MLYDWILQALQPVRNQFSPKGILLGRGHNSNIKH